MIEEDFDLDDTLEDDATAEAPPPVRTSRVADRRRSSRRASDRRHRARDIQTARAKKTRRELGLGADEPLPTRIHDLKRLRKPGREEARLRRAQNRQRRPSA